MTGTEPSVQIRREPPPFRRVVVDAVEPLSPRLVRVTFRGDELDGLEIDEPAASVRLLVPSSGSSELVIPAWNGNEFLLPDGSRPIIRTFTPRRLDPAARTLDLEIVVHDGGAVAAWVASAGRGGSAAVSGPGRGYTVDPGATGYVLAGDETAIPAISQLLESIPGAVPVRTIIEVAQPDARIELPYHPGATIRWVDLEPGSAPGDALVPAVVAADLEAGTRVWAAGEAAAVHRIRRHLFDERGLGRGDATVRGYWKRRT